LALSALLLKRQISDVDADSSSEIKVLNTHYETAFNATLEDLDLDATSGIKTLELLEEEPNTLWSYAYKYPTNCVFLRRIRSPVLKDNRTTQIPRKTGIHSAQKVIFTNEPEAVIEYIPDDVPLAALSPNAGLAIAYRLAILSSNLIVGKGSVKIKEDIQKSYLLARSEAQEHDRLENANFDEDSVTSEFVEARTS
jgi:hypothetical protein